MLCKMLFLKRKSGLRSDVFNLMDSKKLTVNAFCEMLVPQENHYVLQSTVGHS